jgi:hypothetical protein
VPCEASAITVRRVVPVVSGTSALGSRCEFRNCVKRQRPAAEMLATPVSANIARLCTISEGVRRNPDARSRQSNCSLVRPDGANSRRPVIVSVYMSLLLWRENLGERVELSGSYASFQLVRSLGKPVA